MRSLSRLSLCLAAFAGCNDATPTSVPTAGVTALPISATGHDRLYGVAFAPDGSYYAAGVVADGTDDMTDFKTVVAKVTANGKLDTTFGTGGYAIHNTIVGTNGELARGIVVQSTGKIVVSETIEHAGATDRRDRDVALLRFNTNGTLDTTFGQAGVTVLDLSEGEVSGSNYIADTAWGLVAYPDDRLVLTAAQKRAGATDTDFVVARLTANGQLDTSFGTGGVFSLDINNQSATPKTALILADGSIVACGYFSDGGITKPVFFKLTSAGQLDPSFGTGGYFTPTVLAFVTEAYAIAQQGTSFVSAGYGRDDMNQTTDWVSLRITSDGKLDTTYGDGGKARIDIGGFGDNSRNVAVLPDGRVLLAGGGRPTETNVDGVLVMLTPDGKPDTSFTPNGKQLLDFGGGADMIWGLAVDPSKRFAVATGIKGVAMGQTGNDDGSLIVIPFQK